MSMYNATTVCRVCGNSQLEPLLDLGVQTLTGVFPRERHESLVAGPLRLVKCHGQGPEVCGLVQLEHSFQLAQMYGDRYGYRSGLNRSMVAHLHGKVRRILTRTGGAPAKGSVVLDIGSNDGTTLAGYPAGEFERVGIDPTASKFREFYPSDVKVLPEFFSEQAFRSLVGDRQAAVVTSFAMFYDLDQPLDFMREVHRVLSDDGIWVFEQSYLPAMLAKNSYDTICHEHLEYYSLTQIHWMAQRVDFKIVDVEFNDANGGSFSVTVSKQSSARPTWSELDAELARERALGLDGLEPYLAFAERTRQSRDAILHFVNDAIAQGKTIAALGASTKGNVLLQYCGLTAEHIHAIGEVNPDKFGGFTPGTLIPIKPERDVLESEPDYLIVLPWHFRDTFLNLPRKGRTRLVFPLPALEVLE
jgi:NDP-4-keto-2,6-dideoxyhexose 3-C-methyltransferase